MSTFSTSNSGRRSGGSTIADKTTSRHPVNRSSEQGRCHSAIGNAFEVFNGSFPLLVIRRIVSHSREGFGPATEMLNEIKEHKRLPGPVLRALRLLHERNSRARLKSF